MTAKQNVPAPEPNDTPTFEQALERLETIVEDLEGGALSLEDSIARYEEGVKLSRQLGRTLDQAEKRIERLVAEGDGTPTTEPMALGDDDDDEPPAPTARRGTSTAAPSATPRAAGTPELPF